MRLHRIQVKGQLWCEPIQSSDEQISRFHADGFVVIENLIDAELVTQLSNRIEFLRSAQV